MSNQRSKARVGELCTYALSLHDLKMDKTDERVMCGVNVCAV